MSRGTDYLAYVTEQLRLRIEQLGDKILEVQQDIESMHTYYWENYTEMDQYGYENFDNQQALLTQVNANEENYKQRRRMRRMLDAPFFGSVDFVYEGEEDPERFYIGIGNFTRSNGDLPLVYDWRAPVSSLFYDYDRGAASYMAPAGRIDGEILSRWQYKIRGGRMVYEFESDVKIDDDILKQELGANGDVQLKNIVRTIQREQNAIIRNTQDKILVIQGAAGSGKTSIALHRIAYLLYHDRMGLRSSNVLILSPNSVFSDYISHILPELGEENIREMSFDLFAYRQLQGIAADCEDRYQAIEMQMKVGQTPEADWKQSADFVWEAEGFLLELEDRLVDFADISYKGYTKTAKELMTLFYDKFPDIPLLSRMQQVMEYYIDEFETLRGRDLDEEELEEVRAKFRKLYVSTDIYEIYNWFLEDHDLPELAEEAPEKRILAYEDVYPLLYLKNRLLGTGSHKQIRHLVIDEMQDYSYLQYVILSRMFSCSMTILGDRAQTISDHQQDVLTFLSKIYGKEVHSIEMNKSYRNTVEIADYAAGISGVEGITYLQRHGKPVFVQQYPTVDAALDAAAAMVNTGDGGYETAAVLTMTEEEAGYCAAYLEKHCEQSVSYIDRDSTSFSRGITVTTYYQAKGLEFDQVFVIGGHKDNAFYTQFQYICATRALHELYVLGIEE